ncbi:Gamma-tubulin complex component 4 [Armadillidium nasatum]|uniref:Gamma-tubulin complex component n=1 Tax=Armadillidium nasatum TaxID=96803 RepID=A0A5N5SY83_9CRUS|nr:Gamma-tubulin complex component 4 [Armadillidium nasatum]
MQKIKEGSELKEKETKNIPYETMLHELFLALSGHNSSLFDIIHKLENHLNTYNTRSELKNGPSSEHNKDVTAFKESSNYFTSGSVNGIDTVFHPCEVKMISEILEVAKYYTKIQSFYIKVSGKTLSVSENERKETSGHYLSAFATAVYEETNSFQKRVVKLEEEYLKSSNLLLSTIMINMNTYKYLFCELCRLINIVESKELHGCKLLDFLHKEVILSVGELEVVLKRIRNSVQKVLIEQLTYWLIYGELLDPYEELFLKVSRTPVIDKKDKQKSETDSEAIEVSITMEMLPEFIPLSVAEKIVFIGEHILSFERGGQQTNEDCGLILREKEKELIKDFQKISENESFALKEFQDLVETVRLSVAQYIYTLVTNAGLSEELLLLKDIFLLGRGELYQAFYILSGNKRPCDTNINSLFQRAGRQILMEENYLDKFIVSYQETKQPKEVSVWSNLRIEYLTKWPLHKFFCPSVQDKYNAILHFLLEIREVQLRLQDLFVTQKNNKAFRSHNLSLLCWTLRHHMCLMLCNLQYYIQVDVLESQFSELQNNISNVKDYQRICFHHQSFLSSVITQCFLCHPIISTFISSILDKIKHFCNIFEGSPSKNLRLEIEYVKEDFDKAASKLFWSLQNAWSE